MFAKIPAPSDSFQNFKLDTAADPPERTLISTSVKGVPGVLVTPPVPVPALIPRLTVWSPAQLLLSLLAKFTVADAAPLTEKVTESLTSLRIIAIRIGVSGTKAVAERGTTIVSSPSQLRSVKTPGVERSSVGASVGAPPDFTRRCGIPFTRRIELPLLLPPISQTRTVPVRSAAWTVKSISIE